MNKMRLFALLLFVILIAACANCDVSEGSILEYRAEEPIETVYSEPEEELSEEILEEPYEEFYEPEFAYASLPVNIIAISTAHDHTLIIAEDSTLWAWGMGGVGDGTIENRMRPVQIMEDVIFAVAGQGHSFAITSDNMLWAWGSNFVGQLGDGTTEPRLYPVPILDNVVYVATNQDIPDSHVGMGSLRSYAIRTDNSLWAWGHNNEDWYAPFPITLGDGTEITRNSPVRILENVMAVVPTSNGGFALDYDNVLWHWHGEVNIWHEDRVIPARLSPEPVLTNIATISNNGSFAVTTDGRAYTLGWLEPVQVMDGVRYATSLEGANFAITTDNRLVAWGRNRLPDHWRSTPLLGDGTTVDRDTPVLIMENVQSITLKGNTAYAITTAGELWGWGNNGGALGSGLIGDGSIFVWDDIEDDMWDFYVHEEGFYDGIVWLAEDDAGTGVRLSPVKIMENVTAVAPTYFMFDHGWVRSFRTFALTTTGEVWAWGQNDWFWDDICFIGDGTGEDKLYPVKITG